MLGRIEEVLLRDLDASMPQGGISRAGGATCHNAVPLKSAILARPGAILHPLAKRNRKASLDLLSDLVRGGARFAAHVHFVIPDSSLALRLSSLSEADLRKRFTNGEGRAKLCGEELRIEDTELPIPQQKRKG